MSKSKVVVITGAGKGIGRSCVEYCLEAGFKVAALDIDEEALRSLSPHENLMIFVCDVSVSTQVESVTASILERLGEVYSLVNSAGIQRYSTITETSEDEWDLVMNVNLKSAFLTAKHIIPSIIKRGGGVIVNIASVQSYITQKRVAAYTTSKTALLGLTRSIAVDYAPSVRCVAVCPGSVDTPMLRNAIELSDDPEAVYQECVDMHLSKRICPPEEVAAFVGYLISDNARSMTGQAYRIDGGLGIAIGGN